MRHRRLVFFQVACHCSASFRCVLQVSCEVSNYLAEQVKEATEQGKVMQGVIVGLEALGRVQRFECNGCNL